MKKHSQAKQQERQEGVVQMDSSSCCQKQTILAEIIGATGLQHPSVIHSTATTTSSSNSGNNKNAKSPESLNPFVIVNLCCSYRHGQNNSSMTKKQRMIQKTETQRGTADPIWCIEHKCLFLLEDVQELLREQKDEGASYHVQFDVRDDDCGNSLKCSKIGSAIMSLEDIWDICSDGRAEERMELKLAVDENAWERTKTTCPDENNMLEKDTACNILAVRFRFASSFDIQFLRDMENEDKTRNNKSLWNSARNLLADNSEVCKYDNTEKKDVPKFITEMGVQDVGVGQLMRMFTKKSKRGKDGILRILVQPGPDPRRESSTTYLSEQELYDEMLQPSSNWIECGTDTPESLGMVYLEILRCEGLPNMDSGEAFGNKTDAFVCAIYEESLVQTDVIDDRLSPMWMPWSQRAFCFHIRHPFSQLFISVNDFDMGPTGHDGIGRVVVNLNHFESDVLYTLKYTIHPASNVYDREDLGTITIRLRKHIKDPHAYLMASLKPPPRLHVNMKCEKTLPVANFTLYGKHNEDVYDIQLLRNYVNEMLELKRLFFYSIGDSITSLVLWQGQVKVGSLNLPLHSCIAFFGGIYVIERPHLLPGCTFLGIAWIMLASLISRLQHPSPWRRTVSFMDYLHILIHKEAHGRKTIIKRMENAKEAEIFEANWAHRIQSDYDAAWKEWELQLEMDRIGNQDLNTEHDETATDPIGIALASLKPRLFPIQKRLRGYCGILRQIKSVTTWEEGIISFWITLCCIVCGLVLLLLPTLFLLQWACRLFIWIGLGPWARIYYELVAVAQSTPMELRNDEDREKDLVDKMKKIEMKFKEKNHEARQKGEEALKMKSMRILCFGKYIAKVPKLYRSRHYDYPLSESEGTHISLARHYNLLPQHFNSRKVVPSQHFEGVMIPKKIGEKTTGNIERSVASSSDTIQVINEDAGSLREFISFDNESDSEDDEQCSLVRPRGAKSKSPVTNGRVCGSMIIETNFDEGTDYEKDKQESPSGCSFATLKTTYTEVSSYFEEEGIEVVTT